MIKKSKQQIKTREEFEDRIRDLVALIKERAVIFPNDTADAQLARVKDAKRDPLYFMETYFPHYVTCPFAKFHREEVGKIVSIMNGDEAVIMGEAWSRGFGKSSILAIMLPIWVSIAGLSKFDMFIGADKELAMERTAAIRAELQYNERIRYDFPELRMDEGSGEEHDFVAPDNVRFRAQGYKQGIRGKTHGPHRPRMIVIDDLESHKDTNPKMGQEKLKYVLEDAFGAFGNQGGVIIWLGNLTHSHHALSQFHERCVNEPDNPGIRFRKVIAEENGKSNWPEAYPIKKLRAIEQVMTKLGYARHYLMKPGVDGEVFKEEWLRFYNPFGSSKVPSCQGAKVPEAVGFGAMRFPTREELLAATTISYCDPSLGGGETNDYKAIITCAFWGGMYWILDVYMRKASILEMLDYQYELDKRFKTRHYMEQNFWQKLIWQYLPQKAEEKGYMLPIQGIENRLKKEERILSLQPLFEWGHIWHCVMGKDYQLLKEQLLGFPNAGYDDGPDALAGCVERFKQVANANRYETVERGRGSYVGMF